LYEKEIEVREEAISKYQETFIDGADAKTLDNIIKENLYP